MRRIEDFEHAKQVALDLMDLMKTNLEHDGHLAPVAFVFGARDLETGQPRDRPRPLVIALDLRSPDAKKKSAAKLRELAKQVDATFVLTGAECSTVLCTEDGRASRTESILATLEHRSGSCTWLAAITRAGSGKTRVGKFEVLDAEPMGGDFADFLPRRAHPATLH